MTTQDKQLLRFPELPGNYVTVAQAAKILGCTKASVYYHIYDSEKLAKVYRIGEDLLVLDRAEVEEFGRAPKSAPAQAQHEKEMQAWHRRIKQWGAESNWAEASIHASGQPPKALVSAYLAQHPYDAMPR